MAAALIGIGALVAGCTSTPAVTVQPAAAPASSTAAAEATHVHGGSSESVAVVALRPGERWIDLSMPGGTYRPQAEAGGTDDYRCILLDPKISSDTFLSGAVLEPGNPNLVHHAILYRVDPAQVAAAEAKDASDPRLGWSCFGGPGLPGNSDALGGLNSAPWVAGWATSGGEQRFADGTGQDMKAGSRLILQMHYNLLNGSGVDSTAVKLRVAPAGAHLQPLQTLLLPAPVELPCPANETGPLCNRTASIFDVVRRFGTEAGRTVAQTCARPVTDTIQIRSVAGHMHLLGKSIQIDLERSNGTSQRLLDIKVWDFDDQRATVLANPVTVRPGDKLRVTCTHDATLRAKLPALAKLPPRYVVWGEGSSDEMCLGIVGFTQS